MGRSRYRGRARNGGGSSILSPATKIAIIGDSITDYNITANTKYIIGYPTTVTNANPCEITYGSAHNFTTGDQVYCMSFNGMTELNGNTYTVTVVSPTVFTINVDSTSFGTWTASSGRVFGITNSSVTQASRGYLNHAQILLNQRFNFVEACGLGVASETSTAVLARVANSLTGIDAKVLILMIGTNDFTASVTAATVLSNVNSTISAAFAAGVKYVILGTVAPRDADTAPQKAQRKIYNDTVRTMGTSRILIWDYEDAVSTARDSFTWASGMSSDGIHPTALGAYYMVYDSLVPLMQTAFGSGTWAVDAGNLIANPTFSGTGGTASAAAFTNNTQVATSWTISNLGTIDIPARTLSKGVGGEQEITFNFTSTRTNSEGASIEQTVSSGLVAGTRYRGEALLKVSGYTGSCPMTELGLILVSNTGITSNCMSPVSGTPTDPYPLNEWVTINGTQYLRLRTFPLYYDAAFSNLTLRIRSRLNCSSLTGGYKLSIFGAQLYPDASDGY